MGDAPVSVGRLVASPGEIKLGMLVTKTVGLLVELNDGDEVGVPSGERLGAVVRSGMGVAGVGASVCGSDMETGGFVRSNDGD